MKKFLILTILMLGMMMAYETYQKVVYYDVNYVSQIVKQTIWKETKIADNVYYVNPVVNITKEYIPVISKTTYIKQTYIPESRYLAKTYYPVEQQKAHSYSPYSKIYYNYNTYHNYTTPTTIVINEGRDVKYYYNDGTVIIIK